MSKLVFPEDIVIKPDMAIEILQSFIDALNYSVIKESEVKPNGNVMVKGDPIHELLASCIKQQKQFRMDRAYNEVKEK
jgi:putative alpha-1,2-mannosidase